MVIGEIVTFTANYVFANKATSVFSHLGKFLSRNKFLGRFNCGDKKKDTV